MKKIFLISTLILTAAALHAQNGTSGSLAAYPIDGPIKLDGKLNEPVWTLAQHVAEFFQSEPDLGRPATEKTEVAVLYSREFLYIGIWCYDRESNRITAKKMKWDFDSEVDDVFMVMLDTYRDRRNGYLLVVNPNGAQSDVLLMDNGNKTNESWNGIWDVKTEINPEGWFAEIRIPFSTLRSSPDAMQEWGINFERNIRRKNEQVRWQGWSRDANLTQASRAGRLTGLKNIERTRPWEFRPYVIGGFENNRFSPDKRVANLGLDFDYLVTPTVKLDVTVNPDFAQVESDQAIINLTRFSVSYPEKRQFFLEGQNFFNFSVGDDVTPFYSRRIGISQGEEIPILAGTRLMGKIGRATLGGMIFQTAEKGGTPSTNFSVWRWKQDIGEESSIGLLFISKLQPGHSNLTYGADFLYSTTRLFKDKNFQLGGAYLQTGTSNAADKTGRAWHLFMSYPNDFIEAGAAWERAGENLNPEVGFMRRTNYEKFSGEFKFRPRPKFLPWIKFLEFKPLEISYYRDLASGEMQSLAMEFRPLGIATKSGETFEFNIIREGENLTEEFEIQDGTVLPAKKYFYNRYELQFSTYEGRLWQTGIEYEWGRFYNGTSRVWQIEGGLKLSEHLNFSFEYQRNDISLVQGKFNVDEVVGRADFSLTPRLFGSLFGQWNTEDRKILLNFRINWIPKTGTNIFFVVNQATDAWSSRWRADKTTAMLKAVWYFNY